MRTEKTQENKMGVMPVNRLLISMSLPMVISMLVQALYNIVDSVFVSQISENALTAVSLAFPVQNLMIAAASGTGVGVNALLSRQLGERDEQGASRTAHNAILLGVISYAVFAVLGGLFSRTFFESQTDVAEIIEYGTSYLSICTVFSFGIFMEIVFERLLQATGRTMYSMISQSVGAVLNIVFDPILIFGLFGFPKMGVAGAAVATVGGQVAGMLVALYFNIKKNHEIKYHTRGLRLHAKTVAGIYSVGVPSVLMISIGSITVFGMNKILLAFTPTAAAVYGAYFKLQSFVFMPVFGLNNGMVPIIAYNYGAGNRQRITDTIRLSVIYATAMMIAGFLALQLAPGFFLGLFNASEEMLAIGTRALRIISVSFLFAGYIIVLTSVFQALGNGMLSLAVSVSRQLVALLPAAFILSRVGGLDMIWWAFFTADFVSVPVCTFFTIHMYNARIKNLVPLPKFVSQEAPG